MQPGQQIMSIVPPGEPLVLEARVAPHLIDRVHAGLAADVRFASFAHSPQLVVQGEVASVSDGSSIGVVARNGADIGVIGYQMTVLVERAGDMLTPALVTELQQQMLQTA